jgi:hypothetical protein
MSHFCSHDNKTETKSHCVVCSSVAESNYDRRVGYCLQKKKLFNVEMMQPLRPSLNGQNCPLFRERVNKDFIKILVGMIVVTRNKRVFCFLVDF